MFSDKNMPDWCDRSSLSHTGEELLPTERATTQFSTSSQSDLTGIGDRFPATPEFEAHGAPEHGSIPLGYAELNGHTSASLTRRRPNDLYLHPNSWGPQSQGSQYNHGPSYRGDASSTTTSRVDEPTNAADRTTTRNPPRSVSGNAQSKKHNVELPDWFWAHDPENYSSYRRACSYAYSDFNEFKRNSLEMHRRRGNITRENISEERFKEAKEVRPRGHFPSLAEKYIEQWKLVRQELFGTDVSKPIPDCGKPHKPCKPKREIREKKLKVPPSGESRFAAKSTASVSGDTLATGQPRLHASPDQVHSLGDSSDTRPYSTNPSNVHSFPNISNSTPTQDLVRSASAHALFLDQRLASVQQSDLNIRLQTAVHRFADDIDQLFREFISASTSTASVAQQQQLWYSDGGGSMGSYSTARQFVPGRGTHAAIDVRFPTSGHPHISNSRWSDRRNCESS